MYSDYTLDYVLENAFNFVQNIDQAWEELNKRQEVVEKHYFHHVNEISKNKELQKAAQNLINNEYKKLEDLSFSLKKNKVVLQDLKDNVAKMKELRLKKENQLSKLEKDVDKVRKKIQSTLDDREDIEKKKDVILAYKLLTNTSFVYKTKHVTGIVMKNSPKPFSFNPDEVSQEEITQKLWQLVLETKK